MQRIRHSFLKSVYPVKNVYFMRRCFSIKETVEPVAPAEYDTVKHKIQNMSIENNTLIQDDTNSITSHSKAYENVMEVYRQEEEKMNWNWLYGPELRNAVSKLEKQQFNSRPVRDHNGDDFPAMQKAKLMESISGTATSRSNVLVWYLDTVERKQYMNPDQSQQHTQFLNILLEEYEQVTKSGTPKDYVDHQLESDAQVALNRLNMTARVKQQEARQFIAAQDIAIPVEQNTSRQLQGIVRDVQLVEQALQETNTNAATTAIWLQQLVDKNVDLEAYRERLQHMIAKVVEIMFKFDVLLTDKQVCDRLVQVCKPWLKDEALAKKVVRLVKKGAEHYRLMHHKYELKEQTFYNADFN